MGAIWRKFVGFVIKFMTVVMFLVISLFILGCAGFLFPLDVVATLCLGWILYLPTLGPHLRVKGSSVVLGVLCLATFTAGLHLILTRLSRSMTGERWNWRWTRSLATMIVLLITAGLATVGTAYEAGRLISSKELWTAVAQGERPSALRMQSSNNLKLMALALSSYHDDYKTFPSAATFDKLGRPLLGWMTSALPCFEQNELYNQINIQIPWDDAANARVFRKTVSYFLNPKIPANFTHDERGYALTHYAGNALVLGGDRPWKLNEIKDGAAQTILIGEAYGNFKAWGNPVNWRDPALGINKSPDGFGGPFKRGANFAFADGSVRFLSDTIDPRVFEAMGTPNGGEKIQEDDY